MNEGWVLVPREITDEMITACWPGVYTKEDAERLRAMWPLLLAAVPLTNSQKSEERNA